jgi:hypothetical protein
MSFLDGLKQYSYVAGWLSPTIALVGMLIRGGGTKKSELDWARMMLYIGFLTCLAAVFTPVIDDIARFFAGAGVVAMAIYFMVQSDYDADVVREAKRKELNSGKPVA